MIKNINIWLLGYIKQQLSRRLASSKKPLNIIFSLVDHFEPRCGGVNEDKEIERTNSWIEKYSRIVGNHKDSEGKPPKYTFFYPIDEYTPSVLTKISGFCRLGLGEVEIQLHHDNDTPDGLHEKLEFAKKTFREYGLLSKDRHSGEVRYGFIHGNWALDNSRKDGRWCGVNNELKVLRDTGCYADFTLPSAPSDTQTAKINSIYYAKDTPESKSHNRGVDVEVGRAACGDLMIIQGPLALSWKRRKWLIFPRLENAEISIKNPPFPERIDLWVKQGISVKGRPEWVFIKVHTHGCQDQNLTDAYFENLRRMFTYLETKYNDGINYRLYYVTAREMYNIVKAAEADMPGGPGQYKDFLLTLIR
jgi:hypothetical protein